MNSSEYHLKFDPNTYLARRVKISNPAYKQLNDSLWTARKFLLKNLHSFVEDRLAEKKKDLRILEFASGPCIYCLISVARISSEVVLSEYTEPNRQAIERWLVKDPSAFDWKHVFRTVVEQLEGGSESKVEEREEVLRRLIKAVVPCDLTADPPISDDYGDPYDVVLSSLAITCCSRTIEELTSMIKRMAKYIKPGGWMITFSVVYKTPSDPIQDPGFYTVGNEKFFELCITKKELSVAFETNSFKVTALEILPADKIDGQLCSPREKIEGYCFMVCEKQ